MDTDTRILKEEVRIIREDRDALMRQGSDKDAVC